MINVNAVAILAITFCCHAATVAASVKPSPIVQLSGGKVQGVVVDVENEQSVNVFHGIRYARADRFAKPKSPEPWNGVHNATKFQFACPQLGIPFGHQPIGGYMAQATNEDCLFVSVFAPAKSAGKLRPVMVWIHGGGFLIGSEFTFTNDGKLLASLGDVVVVSINYRLGVLGLLYGGDVPPNLGLYDQIFALKWVQENIAAFSGDPKQVTIFGESAGSMSVGTLVLSPLASGLFHRAIMQSGAPSSAVGSQSKADSLKATKVVAKRLHCPVTDSIEHSIACIRNKTVPELTAVATSMTDVELALRPTHETELLPLKPVQALKTGKFNRNIDLLFGVVNDEAMAVFAAMLNLTRHSTSADLSLQKARAIMSLMFSTMAAPLDGHLGNTSEIIDFYLKEVRNASDPFAVRKAVSDAFSDYFLVCPTILFGEEIARQQPKSHYYSYRLVQPSSVSAFGCPAGQGVVCHAVDVPPTFGVPIELRGIVYTDEEAQLSLDMIRAWTNFAKSGQPGKIGGSVEWREAFNRDTDSLPATSYIELHAHKYKMVDGGYKANCDAFWKPRIFAD